MVFALLEGRLLERMILHPHGIHEPESMLDRGSLAGGVHALEHEQQAALATRLPLGVELLLHFRQARRKVNIQPFWTSVDALGSRLRRASRSVFGGRYGDRYGH